METITTYINHMFRGLPQTVEVRHAQTELEQMSLDRYHELRAEGVSEHEAVGRVITQFGNLDELADELGIRAALDHATINGPVFIKRSEADRFLKTSGLVSRLVASGIATILLGVSVFLLLGGETTTLRGNVPGELGDVIALTVLLVFVAIGVLQFVLAGVKHERFERLGEQGAVLEPGAREHFRALREREGAHFAFAIGGGVLTILLGISAMLMIETGRVADDSLAAAAFMIFIAGGVAAFIIAGMRRTALSILAGEGDYTPARRESNKLLDAIAGIYWLTVVAIFFVWGFVFHGWERSWIVWPIAGVLFGIIAIVTELVSSNRTKPDTH